MESFLNKAKAVMIGHAVGDALGVPVEFRSRNYLDANPISDMVGYGSYNVPKGSWSDDTSMSLCALEAISETKVDLKRTMHNFYRWLYLGEFTPSGKPFDVGHTCRVAIDSYVSGYATYDNCGEKDEYSNGNGSLMRIHPFTLYLAYKKQNPMSLSSMELIGRASALTHAHARSKVACVIYSFILLALIENPSKESVKLALDNAASFYTQYGSGLGYYSHECDEMDLYKRLFDGIEKLPRESISSDGYVVHTLEAAVWCLLTTDSYRECVLKAVNLGNDSDTTAAVAGGLAGALYGYNAIPSEWRNTLLRRAYIEELCEKAFGK